MSGGDVTALLVRAKTGDDGAISEVYQVLYRELQKVARSQLYRHQQHTLNTVGLINESFLKMVEQDRINLENRAHFLAVSARAMRQILIDYLRRRSADKRGGQQSPVELNESSVAGEHREEAVLALDDALEQLKLKNERLARVVECKFFGGMNYEEIGEGLGLSPRTVRMDWKKAKAWLTLELES